MQTSCENLWQSLKIAPTCCSNFIYSQLDDDDEHWLLLSDCRHCFTLTSVRQQWQDQNRLKASRAWNVWNGLVQKKRLVWPGRTCQAAKFLRSFIFYKKLLTWDMHLLIIPNYCQILLFTVRTSDFYLEPLVILNANIFFALLTVRISFTTQKVTLKELKRKNGACEQYREISNIEKPNQCCGFTHVTVIVHSSVA